MKDGDIFLWSYTPEYIEKHGHYSDLYWCKSRVAIAQGGILFDTFWMMHGGKRHGGYGPDFDHKCAISESVVELEHWANLGDLVEIWPEDKRFYAPSDVVDLRHSNNSNAPVMIRKGAQRSKEVTRDLLLREIDKATSEANAANVRRERLEAELRELERGCDLARVQA